MFFAPALEKLAAGDAEVSHCVASMTVPKVQLLPEATKLNLL